MGNSSGFSMDSKHESSPTLDTDTDMEDDFDCPICQEVLKMPIRTKNCQHVWVAQSIHPPCSGLQAYSNAPHSRCFPSPGSAGAVFRWQWGVGALSARCAGAPCPRESTELWMFSRGWGRGRGIAEHVEKRSTSYNPIRIPTSASEWKCHRPDRIIIMIIIITTIKNK